MAPPPARLIALLVSAALFGGAAVRQTEAISSEVEKLPPKVKTEEAISSEVENLPPKVKTERIVLKAPSRAKLQTTIQSWHQHSLCNMECGEGVGNKLLTESKCFDLTEDECRPDPSLQDLGEDEGTGKNACMYSCSETTILAGAMCCSYQGQAGWIHYEDQYEKGQCPVAFAEEIEQDKCGEKISAYTKQSRSDVMHLLLKPYEMVEPCNVKCGGHVGDSVMMYAAQLKHCFYYGEADACPGGSAVYADQGNNHLGKRICEYACSGGHFVIPLGSICCKSGWVFPERQQLDETGSATCGEEPFWNGCDASSPIL